MSGVGVGGHSARRRARAARGEACASTLHLDQAALRVLMARVGPTIGRWRNCCRRVDALRIGLLPGRFPQTRFTPSLTPTAVF